MNFSINNVNFNPVKLNFKGQSFKGQVQNAGDSITLNPETKEKASIKANLVQAGIESKRAGEFVETYYGKKEYNDLVNGQKDEDGETYQVHMVDREGNLTPEEAILYLAYDMDEYYSEHFGCSLYMGQPYHLVEASDEELAPISFSPLEVGKLMQKGYDICVAGEILKGDITEEEADKVSKYFDDFATSLPAYDVQSVEYTINKINQNFDTLETLTSTEELPEGGLKSGLTRPLTQKEAAHFVSFNLPKDTNTVNFYIWSNKNDMKGFTPVEVLAEGFKATEGYRCYVELNDKN